MVGDDRDFRPLWVGGVVHNPRRWECLAQSLINYLQQPLWTPSAACSTQPRPVKYIWSESFSSTPQWTSLHIAIAPNPLLGENQLRCSLLAEGQLKMWQYVCFFVFETHCLRALLENFHLWHIFSEQATISRFRLRSTLTLTLELIPTALHWDQDLKCFFLVQLFFDDLINCNNDHVE